MENKLVERWPVLPLASWKETCDTLHLWTQIIGKVRLELSPPLNHWWQVPFYMTACGLTTSSIPVPGEPGQIFEIQLDCIDHQLLILTSSGTAKMIPLIPRSVSAFYQECMASRRPLGIDVTINTLPSEIKKTFPAIKMRFIPRMTLTRFSAYVALAGEALSLITICF